MGQLSAFALFVFALGGVVDAAESESAALDIRFLVSRAQLNEIIHKVKCHAG